MERDRRDAREEEQERAAGPAPAPAAHAAILGLQQSAGNAAVARLLRKPAAAPKALNGLKVNHEQVTVPPDAGLGLKATADPSDAGGEIKYGIASAGVTLDSGTTADAATGAITVADKQVGGKAKATVEQKITADDGSYTTTTADRQISLIDEPGQIASTSVTAASTAAAYQGDFTHTFSPGPGGAAGLERGRVNERFGGALIKDPMSKTHTIASPFGSFTLTANDPASTSAGWELNSSGEMGSADHVSISKKLRRRAGVHRQRGEADGEGAAAGVRAHAELPQPPLPGQDVRCDRRRQHDAQAVPARRRHEARGGAGGGRGGGRRGLRRPGRVPQRHGFVHVGRGVDEGCAEDGAGQRGGARQGRRPDLHDRRRGARQQGRRRRPGDDRREAGRHQGARGRREELRRGLHHHHGAGQAGRGRCADIGVRGR